LTKLQKLVQDIGIKTSNLLHVGYI